VGHIWPGDDSWEPISGSSKHLVICLANQKKFTLLDDAFPTKSFVIASYPRQPVWTFVAVQHHTCKTGAVLADVRWASSTARHEEAVPALWASSLLSEFPGDPAAAHWALGRPEFEKLDAVLAPIRSTFSPPSRQPICPGSFPCHPRTPRAAAPRRSRSTGRSRTGRPTPHLIFCRRSSPALHPTHATSPPSPRASNTSPGARSRRSTAPHGCTPAPSIPG